MSTPWAKRVRHWFRIVSDFALAQGFSQAVGMLAGLVYVRHMPVEEYAVYALCLTALSLTALGSDLGLTGSLGYFWRKYSDSPGALAAIVALIRRVRAILFVVAFSVGAIMVLSSTRNAPTSSILLALCLTIVAAAAWAQMRVTVDILLLRLSGHQRRSYLIEARGNLVRLGVAILMIATGIGTAWFGLLGALLGALVVLAALSKEPSTIRTTFAKPRALQVNELRSYAFPLLPSYIVYMIQEPLVLWLASVRSSATTVAQVHALGRIAAIVSLLGTFVIIVLAPRLANLRDDRRYFHKLVLCLIALLAILSMCVAAAHAFPQYPLMILGSNYYHLIDEVSISMTTAGINVLITLVVIANRTRGWVRLEPIVAMAQIMATIAFTSLWDRYDVDGVLWLFLLLSLTTLTFYSAITIVGLFKPHLLRST